MAKFNHSAPYGTITPQTDAAGKYWGHYHQNGNTFDNDYNHINVEDGKIIEYADGEKAAPIKTKQPKNVRAPQPAPVIAPAPEGEGGEIKEVSEGINLVAWAKGELKGIPWFEAKAAIIAAGYDVPKNSAEAKAAILAKNKV